MAEQNHEHMKWSEQHEKAGFGVSEAADGKGIPLLENSEGTDR